jgi:ribosomal protein S18 acetylase RimI-like enzyme
MHVFEATSSRDLEEIRRLFEIYAAGTGLDLSFQGFREELDSLPGKYARPGGALFLARADVQTAGCIGLRPFSTTEGELKRLYVDPAHRRAGLARQLVCAAIESARSYGYESLLLDTLATMRPAIALYESIGFRQIEPYYRNPIADSVFFRLKLGPG